LEREKAKANSGQKKGLNKEKNSAGPGLAGTIPDRKEPINAIKFCTRGTCKEKIKTINRPSGKKKAQTGSAQRKGGDGESKEKTIKLALRENLRSGKEDHNEDANKK